MKLEEGLKNIGLKGSEIKVYLYLLENGVSTPPQIAKGTRIARTNTYHILRGLSEKGLIERQEKRKRFVYSPTNPAALLGTLERRKETVEQLLPDLQALHKTQTHKPIVRFFEGVDGIKEIFMLMLEAKEILGIASTRKLFELDPKFFASYTHKMKQRQIIFRDLLSHPSGEKAVKDTKAIMGALYNYKLLPPKYGELATNFLIWNDNVILMTLEEPVFSTLITNKNVMATFKIIFEIIWNATPLPPNSPPPRP